jgi:hypothetical protein
VFPNPGFLGSVSSFSEFWNALARHDWVFHNSPFFVTPPFSKPLEIQATSRSGCSKIARIRALWGRSKNQFRVPQIQLRVPTIGYLFHNSADSGIEGDRVGRRRQGSSKATARSRGQGAELLATSSICAHRERLRHGCLPARISTTHGANHRGCNSTACRVSDFKLPNSKCQAMLRDGGNVSRATGPLPCDRLYIITGKLQAKFLAPAKVVSQVVWRHGVGAEEILPNCFGRCQLSVGGQVQTIPSRLNHTNIRPSSSIALHGKEHAHNDAQAADALGGGHFGSVTSSDRPDRKPAWRTQHQSDGLEFALASGCYSCSKLLQRLAHLNTRHLARGANTFAMPQGCHSMSGTMFAACVEPEPIETIIEAQIRK